MKRLIALASISALALALPAAGWADRGGSGGHAEKKLAHAQCKAEKKADKGAFRATYGKHPMKTCKREALAGVEQEFKNAAKECKAERENAEQFAADYGDGRNAFGKCVSGKVRDEIEDEVDEFASAAEECQAKFEADPAGFNERYGGEPEAKRRHEAAEEVVEPDVSDVPMDPQAFANCVAERSADDDEPKDPVEEPTA